MTQPETCKCCGGPTAHRMVDGSLKHHVIGGSLCLSNQLEAAKRELAEKDEQLQTVHAHVKEALEILGVDVSVSGYIPDSWALKGCCRIVAKQLAEKETEAGRLRRSIESALRIDSLWRYSGAVPEEHRNEGFALELMYEGFKAALSPTQEKNDAST